MSSLGIDIGYSSVKWCLLEDGTPVFQGYALHKGSPRQALGAAIEELSSSRRIETIRYVALTGRGCDGVFAPGAVSVVNEVSALIEGAEMVAPGCGSLIEIGGQSSKFVGGLGAGQAIDVAMNENCSAGTGSFLEELASRLSIDIAEYAEYAAQASSTPRIAGRCSVFAKSDITHLLQDGASVPDILKGLALAMAKSFKGSVIKRRTIASPVLFAGGTALNGSIRKALCEVLGIGEGDLVVPEEPGTIVAVGAALMAERGGLSLGVDTLPSLPKAGCAGSACLGAAGAPGGGPKDTRLAPLAPFGTGDPAYKHSLPPAYRGAGRIDCSLGIDVGSTSTNIAVLGEEGGVLAYKYLRTFGEPLKAIAKGFSELRAEWGDRLSVGSVGVTGSGRYLVGEAVGADVIKDEITAQASAALSIDPDIDTIFEIGGQDSKFISLRDGAVIDFSMNKVCAAGTGSFIEEQAKKLGVSLDDFGPLALRSSSPSPLGERCTVFIETSVASRLARGDVLEDIAAGLCYAIARNYLDRVVGTKRIGRRVFLQGGIAFNQGVINAFRALTGREIVVPPFFSVTGAIGAAQLARGEPGGARTRFKGLSATILPPSRGSAGPGRPLGELGTFDREAAELVFADYDDSQDPSRKTVGIPRALFTHGMFPLFCEFFKQLGFNVLLSSPSSERTIASGQDCSLEELCFPLKLVTGHVAELMERKVDYIFFPDVHTVCHPQSKSRQDYGCAYMQLAFKLVSEGMALKERGITLLAPTIAFKRGERFMSESFGSLGAALGRTGDQTRYALGRAMASALEFEERLAEHGKAQLASIVPGEPTFVFISKIYGVADPVLNLGLPQRLRDMGYRVLSFFDMPEVDASGEHPNMFWPFGQHILEPAYSIRENPDLHAIFLTHHSCGPDSILSHYFREIMGDKPYLTIEVDEHSSAVGVITRLEAFLHSIRAEGRKREAAAQPIGRARRARPPFVGSVSMGRDPLMVDGGVIVCVPPLYPYSGLARAALERAGVTAEELPCIDGATLDEGRTRTMTTEYLSLTGLLGSVFTRIGRSSRPERLAMLIPENEGAEADGQYARLLRSRLDEEGHGSVAIVAPFLEDLAARPRERFERICLGAIAGDIVANAPPAGRARAYATALDIVMESSPRLDRLLNLAAEVHKAWDSSPRDKAVLLVGEPFILYNERLNNGLAASIEGTHRVARAPIAEGLWLFWADTLAALGEARRGELEHRLAWLGESIGAVGQRLGTYSPFEPSLSSLASRADGTVGLYSGAFGRYRAAKALTEALPVDCVMTLSSQYENTGILLNALHPGFARGARSGGTGDGGGARPVLNLTFDGNFNENDRIKVESFLYYL